MAARTRSAARIGQEPRHRHRDLARIADQRVAREIGGLRRLGQKMDAVRLAEAIPAERHSPQAMRRIISAAMPWPLGGHSNTSKPR